MLPLIYYPDPILKQKCLPVGCTDLNDSPAFDDELLVDFLSKMEKALFVYHGRGLAAPQVGWALRVFMLLVDDEAVTFINPEIVEEGAEKVLTKEQCLSIPTITAQLRRARLIRVKYQDKEGVEHEQALRDDQAIAFQHELDHLNGLTLFQQMGSAQRMLKRKRYAKWQKKMQQMTQGQLKNLPQPKTRG